MKRRLRHILLVLVTLSLTVAFSDQTEFASTLQEKLDRYYARHVSAKAYLTFNKQKYIPGDTAFYKILLFQASGLQPLAGRQILSVHLLDATGDVVHQSRVLVTNGVGLNQIPVQDDLLPGIYTVIVFPPAMGVDDTALLAEAELLVAGPLLFRVASADAAVNFYPEGGHLIYGITNKVVVSGPPLTSGAVTAGPKQIATFALDDIGTGFFFITPLPGENYFCEISNTNLRVRLPDPTADGVGMLVTVPTNDGAIRVTLQMPENSSLKTEKLFLVLTGHEKLYYTAALSLSDSPYQTFSLPQDPIAEGVARLTVFTRHGRSLAERLVYIAKQTGPLVGIRLPNRSVHVRDTLPLEIFVNDDAGTPIASDFAVTVSREDAFHDNTSPVRNLVVSSLLYGDARGPVEMRKKVSIAPDNSRALDNYLIASTWNGIPWDDVWQEKEFVTPFRKYLQVHGTASRTGGKPLPDSTLVTFFFQKSVMIYETYPDATGNFEFSLLMDFFEEDEIYYKAEARGKVLGDVQVELGTNSPRKWIFNPIIVRNTTLPDVLHKEESRRKAIDRSYAFYLGSRTVEKPRSLNALIEEEVFGSDITINPDDYLLFPTMSETIREIVPMLQHRRIRSQDVLRLYFDDRNRFADEEPMLIIDGVISDNIAYFLSIKPSAVASIRILNSFDKLRGFGSIGKNGMVLVETKIPGNDVAVPRAANSLSVRGLTLPSRSHRPVTPQRHARVPDLRSNLYWNPEAKTDASGVARFLVHASDVTGNFKVKVEGFTKDGRPFCAEKSFEVFYHPD